MFDIKYSKQAVKFLKSLDKKLVSRIFIKIEKLRNLECHIAATSVGTS